MLYRFFYIFTLLVIAFPVFAQSTFTLKSAPADLNVLLNGEPVRPVSSAGALRTYRLSGAGIVRFSAAGYKHIEYHSSVLPVRDGIVQIKLESETGILRLRGEYKTGVQPKSAYFSPDGRRLFVPLLLDHGIDVFRVTGQYLQYEKRLIVPGSDPEGFVEALCDEIRRELWVSNMLENKVHIFNLDSLEYKSSHDTGGVFPKVIVQSPDGKITVVSNWVTMDLSFFDSDTKELLLKLPMGATPRGMAFSPDGALLYTTSYDEPVIAVVDMARNTITTRFRLYPGEGAARHVIYNDGKLYVSDMMRGTVNILNASTGALLLSRRIGPNINTIIISRDGRYIFAASRGRNNPVDYVMPGPDFGAVYMLNAEDLSLVERVWGRNQPTGLAISPDGKLLVFTDFLDENLEVYSLTVN
ncbi:MAG: beta-propeller fold lactonase family protein [Treponema sp.]|nr:beta-propeller fold lactonase family protein [Treponema sp.]